MSLWEEKRLTTPNCLEKKKFYFQNSILRIFPRSRLETRLNVNSVKHPEDRSKRKEKEIRRKEEDMTEVFKRIEKSRLQKPKNRAESDRKVIKT